MGSVGVGRSVWRRMDCATFVARSGVGGWMRAVQRTQLAVSAVLTMLVLPLGVLA